MTTPSLLDHMADNQDGIPAEERRQTARAASPLRLQAQDFPDGLWQDTGPLVVQPPMDRPARWYRIVREGEPVAYWDPGLREWIPATPSTETPARSWLGRLWRAFGGRS
jgi:hypothetical protein